MMYLMSAVKNLKEKQPQGKKLRKKGSHSFCKKRDDFDEFRRHAVEISYDIQGSSEKASTGRAINVIGKECPHKKRVKHIIFYAV